MNLVDIGHRAVALGEPRDLGDRRDVAVHRIEALEHDELGALDRLRRQAAARDRRHRCGGTSALSQPARRTPSIIELWLSASERIRQSGSSAGDRRDAGEIGDPAGSEDQRRRFAVEVGELALQLDDRVMRSGNVARAAGSGAVGAGRPHAGFDHGRMAAHAEIVVRAPDGDFARRFPLRPRDAKRRAESGRRRARDWRKRDSGPPA